MNPPNQAARWWLLFLAGALVATSSLNAQNALYVEYKGMAHAVRKVHNGWVTIDVGGKPVEFIARRSVLQPVEEYLPVLVKVQDVEARTTGRSSRGGDFNHAFRFNAELTSPVALSDVFLVLEMNSESLGKSIVYHEVGELAAGTARYVAVKAPLQERLGPGEYDLHVFAGGREVFHSKQPAGARDAALDRMIARRLAGVAEANPKPFFAVPPVYPEALRPTGGRGEAAVMIRILPNGTVADPVVERSSAPAFGEAALAAVRQWRFLPKVEGGRAVDARVSLPFVFDPPKAAAEKS